MLHRPRKTQSVRQSRMELSWQVRLLRNLTKRPGRFIIPAFKLGYLEHYWRLTRPCVLGHRVTDLVSLTYCQYTLQSHLCRQSMCIQSTLDQKKD